MPNESNAMEQAVARALRDSLERLQRNSDELHHAVTDVVSACSRVMCTWPRVTPSSISATAMMALNNMLAIVNDGEVVERLLGFSADDFKDWLDRVDRGGSILG